MPQRQSEREHVLLTQTTLKFVLHLIKSVHIAKRLHLQCFVQQNQKNCNVAVCVLFTKSLTHDDKSI